MRLLRERHVPRSYTTALHDEPWTTVVDCGDLFAPGTNDSVIANYAEQNEYVIFTRDAPFFEDIRDGVSWCGGLFFHMQKRYRASAIVDAIREIDAVYPDHVEIAENVRDWL